MAIRTVPLPRPTAQAGLSLARLPGWLVWGAMIGLVQRFAIATVGPLGVSTAYPQVDALLPGDLGHGLAGALRREQFVRTHAQRRCDRRVRRA